MPNIDHWSEEDTIPLDIEPRELFYELLSRTKRHTSRIKPILMLTEKVLTEDLGYIDKNNLLPALANANIDLEHLWVFIRKLDDYTKAKQEEYLNSKE
jgi:hypothetical protein